MLAGGIALLLLVLLATGNVVLRIVKVPFAGTYEIVSFLGSLVIAGALGHTQRKKDHIVVDILSEKFPLLVKRFLDVVNFAVTCILFGIVSWQLVVWGDKLRLSGELSETLQFRYYPFVYGVAAGFALLTLVLFLDCMRAIFHREEIQ
ncbi:Tripartite ATP-independent transporter, DctQ component [Geobacter sp. DSM 9736]|nr:Tripartite ATP-independent transporter, DctQ component [Geobacter sp. DSM 9736]